MATYLVTGANRGIGHEYCRRLLHRGDQLIAVCRNSSPELDALGIRVIKGVDLNPIRFA
jgi:NAD(P)-dependent dehydrogenase (short-subunit alcohol dehydrogenase family)